MKILHLIYTNGIAGAEKYLQHLLPGVRVNHIDCHLVIVCAPGFEKQLESYRSELISLGVPTTLFISQKKGFLKVASLIEKYLKQNEINIVHSHLLNSDLLATLVKTFFRPRLVIISTKHGYNENILKQLGYSVERKDIKKKLKKDVHFYVSKAVNKKIDFNFAVSHAISMLYYNLGLTKEPMPYIYHGVNMKQVEKDPNFRLAGKQLISVGRLEEIKGQRYLLEAMPMVIERFPDVKLIFIGKGSEENNLKMLSSSLHIDSNVLFMGFNNNPYPYVSSSDVVIIPSLLEPFGLVYIEAFALNVPVLAFDTAAGNEIIENNKTGLLVPPRDSLALAEKLIYLLSNADSAKKLADRAFEKYQTQFNMERMVNDTVTYYKTILAD